MRFRPVPAGTAQRARLLRAYRRRERLFPLMLAVLLDQQDGVVFVADEESPTAYFVEHKFGFSQICGVPSEGFAEALGKYLFSANDSICTKVRCYCPDHSTLLLRYGDRCQRSQRAQFRLPESVQPPPDGHEGKCFPLEAGTVDAVNDCLGLDLFGRFWRSRDDFLRHAFGFGMRVEGEVVSACYSAAIVDGVAEIDVSTVGTARQKGFGKVVTNAFIRECRTRGVAPNWDCFTNNTGSLALAASLGFRPHGLPYDFFTVPRTGGQLK